MQKFKENPREDDDEDDDDNDDDVSLIRLLTVFVNRYECLLVYFHKVGTLHW